MKFYYNDEIITNPNAFVVERQKYDNKSLTTLLQNLINHRLAYPIRIDGKMEESPADQVTYTIQSYLGMRGAVSRVETATAPEGMCISDDIVTFGIAYGGLPGSEVSIENRSIVAILPFVENPDTNFWLMVIDLPLFVETSGCASLVYFTPGQAGVACHAYMYSSGLGKGDIEINENPI